MSEYDLIFEDATGHEYEIEYSVGLSRGLGDSFKESTKHQDENDGTDGFIDGVRVDFTFAFDHKDHMVKRFTRYVDELNLYLGIRVGNNSGATFSEPVVVLGENAEASYIKDWVLPNLANRVAKNSNAIADAVSDIYCDYCDYLDEIAS